MYDEWSRLSPTFFFFQAEDGIRYYKVTGVQTCALPIYKLLERLCSDHACLAEQRLDGSVGARERGGVGAGRSCTGRGAPALEREDRFRAGDPARDAGELPGVAERLEVESDQVRAVVVLEALEQVVRRDVRLVPDRDERREPDPARIGRLDEREAERTALRREADRPPARRLAREGRIQALSCRRDPEAVRADHSRAVRAHEREQPILTLNTFRADLCEPRGDDAERSHALRKRVLCRADDMLARHADHRQVDRVHDLRHGGIPAHTRDRLALPVDRVDRAREVRSQDVSEELATDRPTSRRGADDGHGRGLEERAKRRDNCLVVAALDALAIALGGRDRERQLDLTPGDVSSDGETDGLEDPEHLPIVREHLRHEALDAERACAGRELLEQPRADAAALVVVGHGERHLRGLRVTKPREVRDGHDAVVDAADECTRLARIRAGERLDQAWAELRVPVKPSVEALLREIAEEVEQGGRVVRTGRTQAQGPSVPKNDVERLCREHGHEHIFADAEPDRLVESRTAAPRRLRCPRLMPDGRFFQQFQRRRSWKRSSTTVRANGPGSPCPIRRSRSRPTRSSASTPRRSAGPTCTSSRATCPR